MITCVLAANGIVPRRIGPVRHRPGSLGPQPDAGRSAGPAAERELAQSSALGGHGESGFHVERGVRPRSRDRPLGDAWGAREHQPGGSRAVRRSDRRHGARHRQRDGKGALRTAVALPNHAHRREPAVHGPVALSCRLRLPAADPDSCGAGEPEAPRRARRGERQPEDRHRADRCVDRRGDDEFRSRQRRVL